MVRQDSPVISHRKGMKSGKQFHGNSIQIDGSERHAHNYNVEKKNTSVFQTSDFVEFSAKQLNVIRILYNGSRSNL